MFNRSSCRDLLLLTPSWYEGCDKSYVWEEKLLGCPLSQASSAYETVEKLEARRRKGSFKRPRDAASTSSAMDCTWKGRYPSNAR
eukprot:7379885-Prymnesium_polylepis.1